ncbi:MAG: aminoacyl-tRNA hydrolase [Patescibacteria group bacterium]
MKLLIGLGNPGEEYRNNRHNAGHMLADSLVKGEMGKVKSKDWKIEKTDTYMNESGKDVRKLRDYYKVLNEDLYVAYDDLDISLGSYKISKGKSPRVHNGVRSVDEALGNRQYWHVRIGIDSRVKGQESKRARERLNGREYVLQDFTREEKKVLEKVLKDVSERIISGTVKQ